MTLAFLDLILFSIWHNTLPVRQGPSADIPLLNQYFYSRSIGRRHLQNATELRFAKFQYILTSES